MSSTRDTKLFDTCDPWQGDKDVFEDIFVEDFKTGLGRFHDDYATQKQQLAGNTPGSVPPSTAAQIRCMGTRCLVGMDG